jgi:hypothetical protein
VKSNKLIYLLPLLGLFVSGCHPLSTVHLQRYLGNTERLLRNWEIHSGQIIRYSHHIRWRNRELFYTGIIKQDSAHRTIIAGLNHAGSTLFIAQLEGEVYQVLNNRTGVTNKILKQHILQDAKLLCLMPPPQGSIVYRPSDGVNEFWVKSPDDFGCYNAFFVFQEDAISYTRVHNDNLVQRGELKIDDSGRLMGLTLNNIEDGYRAEINALSTELDEI